MSRKLPYEQIIRDKMQNLPVPDVEPSWLQMKAILDDKMPVSETASDKKDRKWWWISGLILFFSAGTGALIYSYARDDSAKDVVKVTPIDKTIDISQHNSNATDQNSTSTSPKSNQHKKDNTIVADPTTADYLDHVAPSVVDAKQPGSETKKQAAVGLPNQPDIVSSPVEKKPLTLPNTSERIHEDDNGNAATGNTPHITVINKAKDKTRSFPRPEKEPTATDESALTTLHTPPFASERSNNIIEPRPANETAAPPTREKYSDITAITDASSTEDSYVMATVPNENFLFSSAYPLQSAKDSVLAIPQNIWNLPDVSAKKKVILKEMKRQERKNERDLAKSYRTSHSFWGEHTSRWFAAGLAPYQNFSVGAQQTYNYNSAGGKSMIADYIPTPYLQLHLTDRIYVLSEFQFNSPQSTPSLLLAQRPVTGPMTITGITENTYLRKLYYFNMPLSFYYSPVKNFYLGSGIQFSSLNSGLAYVEQRGVDNTILHAETIKLKDDTLSTRINGSEWRYLFDANYYAGRFMLGFRYNQALNNYVNFKVNNLTAVTQARNQAFQFYIRYNIVVSKRR